MVLEFVRRRRRKRWRGKGEALGGAGRTALGRPPAGATRRDLSWRSAHVEMQPQRATPITTTPPYHASRAAAARLLDLN